MTLERNEHVQVIEGDGYARRQRVVEYKPEAQAIFVSRFTKFMWLVASILTALITFRFVLKMLAANPTNGFVDLMYKLTDVLVMPFIGIVGTPALGNGGVIDMPSVFAIVVYGLITAAIVTLFRILFASTSGSRQVSTIERQS